MPLEEHELRTAEPASPAPPPGAIEQALAGIPALPADALILIPTRSFVLFPGTVLPVTLGRQRSIAAAQAAIRLNRPIGLVLQRDPATEDPIAIDLHRMGTEANVLRYVTSPDGQHHVISQGERRFRIVDFLDGYPFLVARVERLPKSEASSKDIEARMMHLRNQAIEVLQLLPQTPVELVNAVQSAASAASLADLIASFMDITPAEKQEILETVDIESRLERVSAMLVYRIEVLRLSRQISEQTKEKIDDRQREFLLREQMKTIQKELGEGDDAKSPGDRRAVEKDRRRQDAARGRCPMPGASWRGSSGCRRRPANIRWPGPISNGWSNCRGRSIRDADRHRRGSANPRRRPFRARQGQAPHPRKPGDPPAQSGGPQPDPVLCRPPGVGKTWLGQSIARATGRKFVRVSLGGTHDEAEIRGHRRTYIGALPGNIIQGIRRAGARDCVMMLDEIDKLGHGIQGDPASALLEVLDPEQNSAFRDNYLGVPFDLSRVMFITTANVLDTVPGPLRDRMEVIDLPGYVEDEKFEIARRYLVGRQLKANGLTPEQAEIADDAIRAIIRNYTREAGVRQLDREIGAALRSAAMRIAERTDAHVRIEPEALLEILGPSRFEGEVAMRTSVPGVATGLAWTPVGGDILFIEAARFPGGGRLILTGQLGEVMRESAQAALTLVKARASSLGLDPAMFEKGDIHIHVPAGAIPKDGPSAGVAMYTALVSLLTERTVRNDTAMTGEISLRGLVLPVGGIKEKVVAAARAGLASVILPARNRKDYDDIPESARNSLRFRWAERVEEVTEAALEPAARA